MLCLYVSVCAVLICVLVCGPVSGVVVVLSLYYNRQAGSSGTTQMFHLRHNIHVSQTNAQLAVCLAASVA